MKHFLLILLTLLFYSSVAQEHESFEVLFVNNLEFLATQNETLKTLGEPDRIVKHYSEIDDDTLTTFKYAESSFKFYQGQLLDFELRNEAYKLQPTDVGVGSTLEQLKEAFPKSYSNREENTDGSIILRIFLNDSYVNFVVKQGNVREIFTSRHS